MRDLALALVMVIGGLTFLPAERTAAQAPAVRVFAANGVQGALNQLVPACERAIGHRLQVEFGTTDALKLRIEGGEGFDLAVLTSDAIDALIHDGKITAGSRANVARVGVGIAIRSGATKPDLSSPETVKKVLLNAKAITYATGGASRPVIDRMLDDLGIATSVKSKTLLLGSGNATRAAVASGKAELLITLISEIVSAKGLELAGPLPGELQVYITFAVGVSPSAKNNRAAGAAIKFLTGPKAATAYRTKGMEPLK
jgi:molybdate transport system substrate-binding protein